MPPPPPPQCSDRLTPSQYLLPPRVMLKISPCARRLSQLTWVHPLHYSLRAESAPTDCCRRALLLHQTRRRAHCRPRTPLAREPGRRHRWPGQISSWGRLPSWCRPRPGRPREPGPGDGDGGRRGGRSAHLRRWGGGGRGELV